MMPHAHPQTLSIPLDFKLSVIMPCYNERRTVIEAIRRVQALKLNVELIIVDDGSRDGTSELPQSIHDTCCRIPLQKHNCGKGRAIRTALEYVIGDAVVIQGADLEYDPECLLEMVALLCTGKMLARWMWSMVRAICV